MSDNQEENQSLAQQAKEWLLSLIGLDKETMAARDEYCTHLAVEKIIDENPELVSQHLGIESIGRDQTLDPAIKERAYAALMSMNGYDVISNGNIIEPGPPEVGATTQISRGGPEI